MKKRLSWAAIALGLAISAAPAHAAPDCKVAPFSFSACSGSYTLSGGENDVTDGGADNIATQYLNDNDLFGAQDWGFGAKFDGSTSGTNAEGLTVSGLGSTSGTFSFANIDLATTDLAVSLKSAKGFSLYYFEAGSIKDPSDIVWDTAGTSTNKQGKTQALSHFSYYTRVSAITPEVEKRLKKVPEPAAMSGLLAVGMIAALRKRRNITGSAGRP